MTPVPYAIESINALYEEGERDCIFFGQLIGYVTYDSDDVSFEKCDQDRFYDAIELAKFLLSEDYFQVGHMQKEMSGDLRFVSYSGGFEEFRQAAATLFSAEGIDSDYLTWGMQFIKIRTGICPPSIPDNVINLFSNKTGIKNSSM